MTGIFFSCKWLGCWFIQKAFMQNSRWSSIGKKFATGITGLALVLFLIGHLGGNLTLFFGNNLFNNYAHHLESLGVLLYIIEFILLAFFIFHIVSTVSVQLEKAKARPQGYDVVASKGGPSRKTVSSRSMIITGLIILAFVFIHVKSFKFGPSIEQGYVTNLHGEQVRDLQRLVIEQFNNPLIAFSYVAVMVFIGFHLRHGFWSAWQSIGCGGGCGC